MPGGIRRSGHSKRVLEALPSAVQAQVLSQFAAIADDPDAREHLALARGSVASPRHPRYFVPLEVNGERWLVTVDHIGPLAPLMLHLYDLVAVTNHGPA